ncbi:hypothetical protein AVV29_gp039 [Vibrio phage phi 3]|uniref:Uncharacterized protein n=1 Tax=Vibrio phage phi 3 TaxID=1589298 RepID=A0A0B5H2U5_9CAUD|nr:hypothetical protein AVV29_gp039 [Vibrio phage phi 3]AJF40807.1 hypothetical protein SBVP3_0039 [Vibrio phage phi 3]
MNEQVGLVKNPITLDAKQVAEFLESTHRDNIILVAEQLLEGKWHWLIPDSWERTAINQATLYYACVTFCTLNKA